MKHIETVLKNIRLGHIVFCHPKVMAILRLELVEDDKAEFFQAIDDKKLMSVFWAPDDAFYVVFASEKKVEPVSTSAESLFWHQYFAGFTAGKLNCIALSGI